MSSFGTFAKGYNVDLIEVVFLHRLHCRVRFPLQPAAATYKPVPCWLVMRIWPWRRGSTFVKKFWPLPASLKISVSDNDLLNTTLKNLKAKKPLYTLFYIMMFSSFKVSSFSCASFRKPPIFLPNWWSGFPRGIFIWQFYVWDHFQLALSRFFHLYIPIPQLLTSTIVVIFFSNCKNVYVNNITSYLLPPQLTKSLSAWVFFLNSRGCSSSQPQPRCTPEPSCRWRLICDVWCPCRCTYSN